jgi:hypothetical protein
MSQAKPIPAGRKDGWTPNPRDLAETPGGTIYATTPGGSYPHLRIIVICLSFHAQKMAFHSRWLLTSSIKNVLPVVLKFIFGHNETLGHM